jgi:hypothetical protein
VLLRTGSQGGLYQQRAFGPYLAGDIHDAAACVLAVPERVPLLSLPRSGLLEGFVCVCVCVKGGGGVTVMGDRGPGRTTYHKDCVR